MHSLQFPSRFPSKFFPFLQCHFHFFQILGKAFDVFPNLHFQFLHFLHVPFRSIQTGSKHFPALRADMNKPYVKDAGGGRDGAFRALRSHAEAAAHLLKETGDILPGSNKNTEVTAVGEQCEGNCRHNTLCSDYHLLAELRDCMECEGICRHAQPHWFAQIHSTRMEVFPPKSRRAFAPAKVCGLFGHGLRVLADISRLFLYSAELGGFPAPRSPSQPIRCRMGSEIGTMGHCWCLPVTAFAVILRRSS